jgi:CRISPR-associated endonuclease/helicase Cas3
LTHSVAVGLLENKSVIFKSLGLTKEHLRALVARTALFHDLGKATTYFQERLETGRRMPNGEHWHTGLSTILAYKPFLVYCRENHLDESIALAPLLAILYHHSELSKDLPNDSIMGDRLKALKKGILELQNLKEVGLSNEVDLLNPIEIDCCMEDLFSNMSVFTNEQRTEFRLLTLFIYSMLLEADKAYLAVKDKGLYQRSPIPIDSDTIDTHKAKVFWGKETNINRDRERAYKEVMEGLGNLDLNNRLYSLTLPTGMGKTLLAASWAIKLRNKIQNNLGFTPQIIVALPFLSIIDQSAREYEKFLGNPGEELFLKTHSLSSFEFNGYEPNTAEFFVNIWKSQIIMTTFDQLLYALFSFRPKYLMRFHNLLNSIIIMDEAQALPPHLWHPFSTFMRHITDIGKSYLLVMSATQPQFLENAIELIPMITDGISRKGPERYFKNFSRYKLLLKHKEIRSLDNFVGELKDKLRGIKEEKIMIVLNTRDSAKRVYEELKTAAQSRETYFLSSYVIPAERLDRIEKIRKSKRVLVISTQCIEAGVDIDMDYVIRDFGPLDSIIQVAGRCNREGEKGTKIVEVVRLYDREAVSNFCPTGEFNAMVYDRLSIDATRDILDKCLGNEIMESEVFDLSRKYFFEIRRKDLGKKRTECLIDFSHKYIRNGKERTFDIRAELRGELIQYNLIVEKYVPGLRKEIEEIFKKDMDRWERRRKLKNLSGKIAMNSISVNAYKFNPGDMAEKGKGDFYFLDSRYYDGEIGFNFHSPPGTYIV